MRLLGFTLLVAFALPAGAAETALKVATLAPEGSTWWQIFQDADRRLGEATEGRVRLKIYAGGVAGDEPDIVRKMRVGSLHGGAITSVGLGEIQPALLVLQAPGLFRSWDELDRVRERMAERFRALLAEKGYVVFTWGDIGMNYVMSAEHVQTPEDLRRSKVWLWTHDSVYRALFEAAGIAPVPLGVPDVLPSMQTGLVNALITAPLAAVSLQWFARVKHVLNLPIGANVGAIVLTKKAVDKLNPVDQTALMQVGTLVARDLSTRIRVDNAKALEAMKRAGVQVHTPGDAAISTWAGVSRKATEAAAGVVYPKELLTEIQATLQELRSGH